MKKNILIIICMCIIIILLTGLFYKSTNAKCDNENITIINKKYNYDDKYNEKKKYYNMTNYKIIKQLFKEKKVYTFAITNNKSNTKDSFIELINKISFYNNENIYLINTSDLSKKDKAKYYNLNKELKNLESDCIIKIYNKKIISKTTYTKSYIKKIIDSYE